MYVFCYYYILSYLFRFLFYKNMVVIYVFLLEEAMYCYCYLCTLIVSLCYYYCYLCIVIVIYVYLLLVYVIVVNVLSMYS